MNLKSKMNDARPPRRIDLHAEYGASPVWEIDSVQPEREIQLESLVITEDLRNELRAWSAEHETFAPVDDLHEDEHAKFPARRQVRVWAARGRELAKKLSHQLGPDVRVRFRR